MVLIPVFLGLAAAAAVVNGWLIARTGNLRRALRISVGDGGNEALLRRMRAQSNFLETTPFFLFLVLGLELSGASRIGLAGLAAIFILARISHGIGMEGGDKSRWRMYGMMGTTFPTLALIFWALIRLVELGLGR
ncbi:MAG: MAPEG family protein [Sphingomonas sp.]|nr:MAPEG family protein [Sphingomonas sp.]MBW0006960.1 MAPEG family protein [Sphingomonas sp.]